MGDRPARIAAIGKEFHLLHNDFLATIHPQYGKLRGVFYSPYYQKMFVSGKKPEHFLTGNDLQVYNEHGKSFLSFESRFAEAMSDLIFGLGIVDCENWALVDEIMQTRIVVRKRRFRLSISHAYSIELIWSKIPTPHRYMHLSEKYVELFAARIVSLFGCCVFPDFIVTALFTLDARPERDWLLRHLELRDQEATQKLLIELMSRINEAKEHEFIRRRAAA